MSLKSLVAFLIGGRFLLPTPFGLGSTHRSVCNYRHARICWCPWNQGTPAGGRLSLAVVIAVKNNSLTPYRGHPLPSDNPDVWLLEVPLVIQIKCWCPVPESELHHSPQVHVNMVGHGRSQAHAYRLPATYSAHGASIDCPDSLLSPAPCSPEGVLIAVALACSATPTIWRCSQS